MHETKPDMMDSPPVPQFEATCAFTLAEAAIILDISRRRVLKLALQHNLLPPKPTPIPGDDWFISAAAVERLALSLGADKAQVAHNRMLREESSGIRLDGYRPSMWSLSTVALWLDTTVERLMAMMEEQRIAARRLRRTAYILAADLRQLADVPEVRRTIEAESAIQARTAEIEESIQKSRRL